MPHPTPTRALWRMTSKELVSSLRDRQTAVSTLVVPICLYPVVFWLMIQGFLVVQGHRERTRVAVRAAAVDPADPAAAALLGEVAAAFAPPAEDADEVSEGAAGLEAGPPLEPVEPVDLERATGPADDARARAWLGPRAADGAVDAALLFGASRADGAPTARLFFDGTKSRSEIARDRLQARLPELAETLRARAAAEAGVDPAALDPVEVAREDVAPRSDTGAVLLSSLLPLLLVAMTVMGAFFPAVDLTAGEKERRTAETTMLLPVPRAQAHLAKILAVTTTAVVAAFLNLLALGLSAGHLLGTLSSFARVEVQLPVLALVSVAPLALLFAFFTSAVLTGVAGLAATFKEGQALLGPVQMLFLLPAMVGVMPGLQLDLGLAFVPVVNVALAFRALLLGQPLYAEYAATALALTLYAWLAIVLAVRLLSRESVVLASATLSPKTLLSLLRGTGTSR